MVDCQKGKTELGAITFVALQLVMKSQATYVVGGGGGAGEIEMLHENCKTAEPCKIGSERLAVN